MCLGGNISYVGIRINKFKGTVLFFFFPTRLLTVIVSGVWCFSHIHPLMPRPVNPANERMHHILNANTELIHLPAETGPIVFD